MSPLADSLEHVSFEALDEGPLDVDYDVYDDDEDLLDDDEPEDDEDEEEDDDDEARPSTVPAKQGEFVCQSCFLRKRPSQLADAKAQLCLDCV